MTWKQRWRQEGGGQELVRLALPLVLSNSFLTLQVSIDRALLSQFSSDPWQPHEKGRTCYLFHHGDTEGMEIH